MKTRFFNSPFLLLALCLGLVSQGSAVSRVAAASPEMVTRYVAPNGNDTGDCTNPGSPCKTINYARAQTNNGDTISLAAGTYVENVNIFQDTTIVGADKSNTIIDGGGVDTVLTIFSAITVYVSDVTIQNGDDLYGGGIDNNGALFLTDVVVTNNHASIAGGGINNNNYLILLRTILSNNTSDQIAGGFMNFGWNMEVDDSAIIDNTAGPLHYGGGGHNNSGATLYITNTTISGNTAGGGGGLSNSGTAKLENTTVAYNTVTNNFAAGLQPEAGIQLFMTIVADNIGGAQCQSTGGTIASLGYNLASDASCNLTATGDKPSANAGLEALNYYGSSTTPTHSLKPGVSAALDGGTNTNCPPADQRGQSRPVNGGISNTCDIGAHEYNPATDKPRIFLPIIIRQN
jgi:hypothetical protein